MQNSLILNRGFDIEDGIEFFNRVFIKSLQSSLVQKPITIDKTAKKTLKKETLYSFYELKVVDDTLLSIELNFLSDGAVKRRIKSLRDGKWIDIELDETLILVDKKWKKSGKSYKIERDSIVVDGLFKIDIIDSKRVKKIDNLSFPTNSRVIKAQVTQLKDLYQLNREIKRGSLGDFIKRYSLFNTFDGFCGGGVSFGKVIESQNSGNIWYINGFDKKRVISKTAGKWEIKEIDGVEILEVEIRGYDKRIYAEVDGRVYIGEIKRANQKEWISYNRVAFETIKRALSL